LLQTVELPNTLKELRDACFSWCYKLSDINLPEGLTDIRTYVFNECAIENVTIPSTVTNIMERAFGYLDKLNSVTFKKSLGANGTINVPSIHTGAFVNSGSENNPVIFNLPWSEEQHYSKYSNSPAFGASYYVLNFDYEEAN
jgi:hypothetical protein